ncbi:hypothetical protein GPECTOR_4g753 [Gonium pectorale]|uniref:Transcription factor CBF/NF-Y/archaeal histone domain-containing protein n=1 Tax=Gonium pectorale TaxID=33097 RepID=A0A150GXQ4_GONPE|nr:hypothetical protein GPECTOR_4g753 [Gonium pectorale]|eukprot:KXZ54686.1 hypothetical protein GPECTOR_4g753 [Gonium pectorale]
MDVQNASPEKPETDVDVPRALVKRIVKAKLQGLTGGDGKEFGISKDALTALSESTKVFISLIASTANDICQEKRRSTVNADDIFNALGDLDFPELVGPLKEQLEAFKEATKERSKSRPSKKRKSTADAPAAAPRTAMGVAGAVDDAADTGGEGEGDAGPLDGDLAGALVGDAGPGGDDDGPLDGGLLGVADADAAVGLLGGTAGDDGLGNLGLGLGAGDGEVDVESMLVDAPPGVA